MTSKEILKALEKVDSVFISVQLIAGAPPILLRWKDKSLAIRRKIRAQVNTMAKDNPRAEFNARVIMSVDKIIVVGEEATAQ